MKFFHTADWHLGKMMHGVSMLAEQREVLEQLVHDVAQVRPDAVLIAGDLFDKAIPPIEAVTLLNDIWQRIVLECHVPVIAIAGNHDSAQRIHFGQALFQRQGLHVLGTLDQVDKPIVLHDEAGEVHITAIPYAEPSHVREWFHAQKTHDDFSCDVSAIRTHDEAWEAMMAWLRPRLHPHARHVLVAHAFVTADGGTSAQLSDAQRPLAVGGAEYVRDTHFSPFHYVALGHLHQAHRVRQPHVRYAGTPFPYSIQEATHDKGYSVITVDACGGVTIDHQPLRARRTVRIIRTTLEDMQHHARCEDYVFVTLCDTQPVIFPMEKVRTVYPNALHVQREGLHGLPHAHMPSLQTDGTSCTPLERFAAFYRHIHGTACTAETAALFEQLWAQAPEEAEA